MRGKYYEKLLTNIQAENHIIWKVAVDFAEEHDGKYRKLQLELRWSLTPHKIVLGR
jgi:hypothetical protein